MSNKIYNIEKRQIKDFTFWRMRYVVTIVAFGTVVSAASLITAIVTTGALAGFMSGAFAFFIFVTIIAAVFVGIQLDSNRYDTIFWPQRFWLARRGWVPYDTFYSDRSGGLVDVIEFYQEVAEASQEFPEIDTLTRLKVTQSSLYDRFIALDADKQRFAEIYDNGRNTVAGVSIKSIQIDQKAIASAMREICAAASKIANKERAERVAIASSVAELATNAYTSDVSRLTEEARQEAEIAKQYIISRDS